MEVLQSAETLLIASFDDFVSEEARREVVLDGRWDSSQLGALASSWFVCKRTRKLSTECE